MIAMPEIIPALLQQQTGITKTFSHPWPKFPLEIKSWKGLHVQIFQWIRLIKWVNVWLASIIYHAAHVWTMPRSTVTLATSLSYPQRTSGFLYSAYWNHIHLIICHHTNTSSVALGQITLKHFIPVTTVFKCTVCIFSNSVWKVHW